MFVIAGHIRIDATNRDAAITGAKEMMDETLKEKGCLHYVISADVGDEGLFHLFEEWESQEALDAHFKSPHMAQFQKSLGSVGVKELKVRRYEVSSVGPLGG